MSKVIGKFVPKEGNTNKEFEVVSKQVSPCSGSFTFFGQQVNGKEYRVYSEWWQFVEEPKVKQFDIKKDKWFIHVPDTEQAYAVEAWLKEQGFGWIGMEHTETIEWMYDSYGKESCIASQQDIPNRIGYADKEFYIEQGTSEIILTYKTVIDTITLPVIEPEETEPEAQKQLKVLKEQIAELSKQAEVLEGSL